MKLVLISDTHLEHHRLALPPGDALVHAGDFSARGRPHEIADFLQWMAAQPYTYKIFIAGNHDFMAETHPEDFEKMIPPGLIYLNDSGATIEGVHFWGSPITPWFFDWAFNRQRGADIRRHWDMIPSGTDVLITHGPPYGILDRVARDNSPVGCRDLGKKILEIKPALHVFGHIHEGYGQLVQDGVTYVNASVLNERYALVNTPVIYDTDVS